uniref:Uncharacterized protein n=1 Tax=Octopus bimaculoides TaxID=37653 RepID=A0A0L8GHS0_OCTBM
MEDGQIPKVILCGELAAGQRNKGCLQLRYKDDLAVDRTRWKSTLLKQLWIGEEKLSAAAAEKRARCKGSTADRPDLCGRDCYLRIGHHSHSTRCSSRAAQLRQ